MSAKGPVSNHLHATAPNRVRYQKYRTLARTPPARNPFSPTMPGSRILLIHECGELPRDDAQDHPVDNGNFVAGCRDR